MGNTDEPGSGKTGPLGDGAPEQSKEGGSGERAEKGTVPAKTKYISPEYQWPSDPIVGQIQAFHPELLTFCKLKLSDEHEAEDLAQEILVRALKKSALFEGRSTIKSWLFTLARREFQNYIAVRRHRRLPTSGRVSPEYAYMPDTDSLDRLPIQRKVFRALGKLTKHQRVATYLRYYRGCSVEQIAQKMKISPSSIKSHLARAASVLREELRDHE